MSFVIVGKISDVETIAKGSGIRELKRLRKVYGPGKWRKRKGIASVRLPDAQFVWLKYTGTKRPGLAARNTRLSTCFDDGEHG